MPFDESNSNPLRREERPTTPETERLVRETIEGRGVNDPRVLAAMRRVPREAFVPVALRSRANDDSPLPIGEGQTISQPYIVARMTEIAALEPSERCLEIGTGSGYQTGVLSLLCREVTSIEYLARLAPIAARNLGRAGLLRQGIHLRHGDGYHGWPEHAPFDVIVLTTAPPRIPDPLLQQLALGGRLVAPVGNENVTQRLECWRRTEEGDDGATAFEVRVFESVRFVSMLGTVRNDERRG